MVEVGSLEQNSKHLDVSVKDVRSAHIHEKGENTDYSEWQRTSKSHGSCSRASHVTDISLPDRPTSPDTEIVRLQIKARRKTLQQYQRMKGKLVSSNLDLMSEIKNYENGVHDDVTSLLQKYEAFRDNMGSITHKSEISVQEAHHLLEETRVQSVEEIADLEDKVREISSKVLERTVEHETLLKFKGTDKEYHVRVARTMELKQEKEALDAEQQSEQKELLELVRRHYCTLDRDIGSKFKTIQSKLTASAIQNIPETLRELALQNRVMKHELQIHKDNIRDKEREVQEIKDKLRALRIERRKSTPKKRDICTPDMELKLDIPTFSLLPV